MPIESHHLPSPFESGAVILSLDTEQIWGYSDQLSETQFQRRYPGALDAQFKVLACLTHAGVSATWFLVGGMALPASLGAHDRRMAGLPLDWTASIPAGDEISSPLWYRRSFVEQLRQARPFQEIGLHGGLTHLIWTDAARHPRSLAAELAEGVQALQQALVRPLSFSFGREQEAYHDLLPAHGIRCYRGRTVTRAFQLGPTFSGAWRASSMNCAVPRLRPVWPHETLPGLWNIPSSAFLYPIGALAHQRRRPALPPRTLQPRTGSRRPPARHLPLLPASRKSDRIPARLLPVRRHAGAADAQLATAAISRF